MRRVERLKGCFISCDGSVEISFRSPRTVDSVVALADMDSAQRSVFSGNGLSENEALDYMKRVPGETGQLVLKTADGAMTAWFAGIGDPDDLFIELRPMDAWADRDEMVMGTLCSLAEAEELLRALFRGGPGGGTPFAGDLVRRRASRGPETALVGEVDDGA